MCSPSSVLQKPRGAQGDSPTFPCCKDGVCLGGMSHCLCVGKQMLKQLVRAEHVIPVKCNANLARGLNLFKSNHLQGIFEAGCKWNQNAFLPSAWGKVQQKDFQHWLKALAAGLRSHFCPECPLWPHTSDFISVCAWVGQWNTLLVQDSTCRINSKSKKIKKWG